MIRALLQIHQSWSESLTWTSFFSIIMERIVMIHHLRIIERSTSVGLMTGWAYAKSRLIHSRDLWTFERFGYAEFQGFFNLLVNVIWINLFCISLIWRWTREYVFYKESLYHIKCCAVFSYVLLSEYVEWKVWQRGISFRFHKCYKISFSVRDLTREQLIPEKPLQATRATVLGTLLLKAAAAPIFLLITCKF